MPMNKIEISVCVPTYKRPHMLRQTIQSFLQQQYLFSEMVIVDDCSNDETESIVRKFQKKDKRIKYIKNKKNLGYCKNFLKTLLSAKGKYLFLLGDDDLIIGKDTLKRYVDIFKKNKNVGFIYSNIIQFNNSFSVDYVYRHFLEDKLYPFGKDALSNLWLKCTFAGGIGLRNRDDIKDLFPHDDVLFPLVEMIGKILIDKDGYGISAYSVGMRVHSDQLGFHMIKKKRVVGRERHAYLELYEISDNLNSYIKKEKKKVSPIIIKNTIESFLKNADNSVLISEATHLPKRVLIHNVYFLLKKEKRIKHSFYFWSQLVTLSLIPNFSLVTVKEIYRAWLRKTIWKDEVQFFSKEVSHIKN